MSTDTYPHISTAADYARYEQSVANFLEVNKVKPGCHGAVDQEPEPFFSWHPCGCCGRSLGGNRERYSFAVDGSPDNAADFEADICTDCVYYLAYGTLDDMTMLQVSK